MAFLTLVRCGWTGRYGTDRNAGADCVVACSFGARTDAAGRRIPGPANQRIADVYLGRFDSIPAIMQHEVFDALPQETRARDDVHRIGGSSDAAAAYLSTRGVLIRARDIMAGRGWTSALVLGHAYHIGRIQWTAQALGIDARTTEAMPALWDEESNQRWTRSVAAWRMRELLVVAHQTITQPCIALFRRAGRTDSR